MQREKYVPRIADLLVILAHQIETAGGLHLYSKHKFCEDLFKKIFNSLYGYKLVNINLTEGENYPAIDLADKEAGICIQVTSDPSITKVKDTIKVFCAKKLNEEYPKLNIYVISTKKGNFKKDFETSNGLVFDKEKDIQDKDDVIRYIAGLDDLDKIKEICEMLEQELGNPSPTVANEVETIMDFINYLSENKSDEEVVGAEDPDPEKKIMERFADQSEYLKQQVIDYIPLYSNARKQAESKLGVDKAMIILIRHYLMDKSVQFLDQSDQDPKKALDSLTEHFVQELSKSGKKYDYGAIRYYLIQEIINCNVFPNPIN